MVGEIMRSVVKIDHETSLGVASTRVADSGIGVIAVTKFDRFIGVLTDADLARAFADDVDSIASVEPYVRDVTWVSPYSSAAEGLRRLVESGSNYVVVVDDDARPVGILNSYSFWGSNPDRVQPPVVGGMATPFGVYLTNGAVSGGVKPLALVSTGVLMFSLLMLGRLAGFGIEWLAASRGMVFSANTRWVLEVVQLTVFVGGFKLLPISGTHAAEHQVVHALERDEPLVPEIVARMPRVHPRCGTNIAVALSLFMTIAETPWVPWDEVRLVVAAFVTLFFWRPVGSFVQQYITTKPANRAQLESGIKAANELLANFAVSPHSAPNPFQRVWKSGLLHVMAGSLLCVGFLWILGLIFHFDGIGL